MLPDQRSPSSQKAERTRRVLDWVQQSFQSKTLPKCGSYKRKLQLDAVREAKCAKVGNCQSVSPKKFYPLQECINIPKKDSTIIQLPSTPESKYSHESNSSNCCSPLKLDGIFVSNRPRQPPSTCQTLYSESDSDQVTPVKQDENQNKTLHKLPCGLDLDSPTSDCLTPTPKSEKKFFKLGHRIGSKTPLQLYKESIANSTKRIRPSRRNDVSYISTGSSSTGTDRQTDTHKPAGEVTLITKSCEMIKNQQSPSVTTPNNSQNMMDMTNNTLIDPDSSPRMVQKKLLPLFKRNQNIKEEDNQLVIDAGQKDLDGATQCTVCRMIYSRGDPNDEALHRQFHTQLTQTLKFTGWKKENVAEQGSSYRIIYIDHNDMPYCRKKVQSLKAVLDQELGFVPEADMLTPNRRVYLFVSDDKFIKGVCIVESISRANRLIGDRVSEASSPAYIGVNRIWVYAKYRRHGIATKLLDAIRSTYGLGMCVPRCELAFSDPTNHGKSFAEKYTGEKNFLVYKP